MSAELDRLWVVGEAVFEVGATDGGGGLRPQRQSVAAAVLEDVHLFLDDVGGVADAAHEEVGVLDDRRVDRAVAG